MAHPDTTLVWVLSHLTAIGIGIIVVVIALAIGLVVWLKKRK